MNAIFSFKRIGLILRADWIENRKSWMISMGLLLLAYVLMMWDQFHVQNNMVGWTVLFSAILFFNYVGKKIHRSKGLFLTLPASNQEKFIAIWLVALFYIVSCFVVLWCAIGVNNLISGYPVVELFKTVPKAGTIAVTVFFTCWLFASYVTFRKNAFFIGVALLIALVAGVARILFEVKTIKFLNSYDWGEGIGTIFHHYYIVVYLLSAALLYYSYWRLTKKQIR